MKRAIVDYFPIVEINHLAVPERNSFKPIYTMHKWFARRSSSVFRAILLGTLKPAGTDIMKDFYKDHTNDIDTEGKLILDPFMGGGTTIVEALRLGCNVTGIDLNPIAWFIVKTEVEPVDINELNQAFERLSNRIVKWSGKALKDTLLELYMTECPCCGNKNADIIYTFWVKSAPCTTATCNHKTPLFSDYIIAHKSPSIRYYEDCICPKCKNKFDIEIESASLVGNNNLMINASKFSAGIGRAGSRWTYLESENNISCPWCNEKIIPPLKGKTKKKKIPLKVLFCPYCEEVWQYRGDLSQEEEVNCPSCRRGYKPFEGNLPSKGKFICRGTCGGNVDGIINSIRKLQPEERLPIHPYAIEGYCNNCAGNDSTHIKKKDVFFEFDDSEYMASDFPINNSILKKNNGKFFKRIYATDLAGYNLAKDIWEKEKNLLPYPKSIIPNGEKTKSGLIAHHYYYWYQMFNERQLLSLSTLLNSINEEENIKLRDYLVLTFSASLERNNMFCRYFNDRNTIQGSFDRHDFAPKLTPAENSLWSNDEIRGSFPNMFKRMIEGIKYRNNVYDIKIPKSKDDSKTQLSNEKILNNNSLLFCGDSDEILNQINKVYDAIITDPPYAGNVNYSELSDFFFVWIRIILKTVYKEFTPEYSPKSKEIIENKSRNLTNIDFKNRLLSVFSKSNSLLKDDGICAFTYHHSDDSKWTDLLDAINDAGFIIESIYPVHSEKESSLLLQNSEGISFDLIHICKKRKKENYERKRPWATIRLEIRQQAREEIKKIESGRYGGRKLSIPDINIILIGKCLSLYSKYQNSIVDFSDNHIPIERALKEIKMMVDQLISRNNPLPSELEDIDVPSYIYFTALCRNKEISSDNVNKSVRGIIDSSELKELGIITKGREKRGRTFEIKQPIDRLNELKIKFKINGQPGMQSLFNLNESSVPENIIFVDVVHLLLGLAETGESVQPWIERFSGLKPQVRSAMEYLKKVNKNFNDSANRVLAQLDVTTLFTKNK